MRVNVQLIEAETGAHLWAERFDKPVADLFDMQDEIVSRGSPTSLTPSSSPPRRGALSKRPIPIRWTSIFRGKRCSIAAYAPDMLAKARRIL